MKAATIRDLRTQFPKIRRMLEQEGQLVVTDRGRPIAILQPYSDRAARRRPPVDYYGRLRRRMPKPLTAAARRALDDANRGER